MFKIRQIIPIIGNITKENLQEISYNRRNYHIISDKRSKNFLYKVSI